MIELIYQDYYRGGNNFLKSIEYLVAVLWAILKNQYKLGVNL